MLKNLLTIMLKNLLLVMSLSGTVVFLFYLLTYPLAKRYVSLKWRYRILKIALIFYLLPFPLCKYYVWGFFYDRFSLVQEIASQYEPLTINTDYIIVVNYDSILLSPKVKCIYIVIFFIILISFFILWKQISQYRKIKQIIFFDLGKPTEQRLQEIFFKNKTMLNIKKNIKLICSEYCESPITSGILSPTIIFPIWSEEKGIDDELYKYIITHELIHISHNDVLIKLLGVFAMAIHWFNPFIYWLNSELSCISEMYTDSLVMDKKEEEERRKYGELLLMLVMKDKCLSERQMGVGFANFRKKYVYKRRILEMKRNRTYKTFLSVAMTSFICLAGTITVFAYNPPNTFTNGINQTAHTDVSITAGLIQQEKLSSDYFFTSDNGAVYDLNHTDETTRSACIHSFYDYGTVSVHERNNNGGCTMRYYVARRCAKCGDIERGELVKTEIYESCPH